MHERVSWRGKIYTCTVNVFLFQKAPLVLCFVHSRYEFQLLLPLYFCQIKETLARELSERFSGEINLLRHEVRVRANSVFVACHVIQMHAHAWHQHLYSYVYSFIRNIHKYQTRYTNVQFESGDWSNLNGSSYCNVYVDILMNTWVQVLPT